MPFKVHPAFEDFYAKLKEFRETTKPVDYNNLKEVVDSINDRVLQTVFPLSYDKSLVDIVRYRIPSYDEKKIDVMWYTSKHKESNGPAVVFYHGGGYIAGSQEYSQSTLEYYVANSDVSILSVGYRLATVSKYPTPHEDCYAGLSWLVENAKTFDIDPLRIAVMGNSAGGGLAASVAIMARDRKLNPPLKLQYLVYPMIDDTAVDVNAKESFKKMEPFLTWTFGNNKLGWNTLLGDAAGSDDIPPTAAPARLKNFENLPPAHIECGELDIFRDEDIAYAKGFWDEGINCRLKIIEGVPHSFECNGDPNSLVIQTTWRDRIDVLKTL